MKRLVPAIFAAILLVSACDTFKVGVFEDEMILPLEGSQEDSLFYKVSIQYASGGTLIPASEELITDIDKDNKTITIALPEGILEL